MRRPKKAVEAKARREKAEEAEKGEQKATKATKELNLRLRKASRRQGKQKEAEFET